MILTHPTALNLSNFKMVEAMELKVSSQDPLEWHHHLPTKFHENLPVQSY
jgi:hypothetical protein